MSKSRKGFLRVFVSVLTILSLIFSLALSCYAGPVSTNVNEKVVTNATELKTLAKEYGIELKQGEMNLTQLVIRYIPNTDNKGNLSVENSKDNVVSPNWAVVPYWYIVTTGTTNYGATAILHTTTGYGPGTISQQINESLSCQNSWTGGISAGTISAQIGYNITSTFAITDQYSLALNANQYGRIDSHVLYKRTYFDVWYCPFVGDDFKDGSGYSDKPIGIAFAIYTNP